MKDPYLKPCPFCGNRYMTIFRTTSVDIECRYCSARARGKTEEDAVRKWNTRCAVPDILEEEKDNDNN